ncbi:hypothetical protein ACFPM3_15330 [Streptomyces coeruleoprunus]|uniref:Small hydrophobic membrane protein n=1 Tax=Streptomyces coeruleoprunus TaxID=285563 RepID=A0ABV9XDH5_9ACTN
MLFLVAALLLLGIVIGTAALVPVPVTAVAAGVIAAWLLAFAVRERQARKQRGHS